MNTYSSTTRAACDRCHRLKMRCVVEENGSQCNRCAMAETPCKYSPPRKPGRPSIKSSMGTLQGFAVAAIDSPARPAQRGTSTCSPRQGGPAGMALPLAQGEFDLAEHMASFGPDACYNDLGALTGDGLWHSPGLLEEFDAGEGGPYLMPREPWALPAADSHLQVASGRTSTSQSHAGERGDREGSAESTAQQAMFGSENPVPAAYRPTSPSCDKPIAQQISDFHSRLAVCPNPEDHVEPQELERTAALVLELSDAFLLFFWPLRSGQGPARYPLREQAAEPSCQGAPEFHNPATALQLVVFAMRLTELHQRLYTGVYKYMEHADRLGHEATAPISVAIAGVSLVPHPMFQMQMLLHTAAHYLQSIQKALRSILSPPAHPPTPPLDHDPAGSGPPNPPAQGHVAAMRVLVELDQRRRIGGIRETLQALQRDFNMAIHVESLFDRQSSQA